MRLLLKHVQFHKALQACLLLILRQSIEANVEAMTVSLSDVTSGSVTLAVRDTTIDGLEIHENDILGMVDGKILVSTPDMDQALLDTFDKMIDEDSEIVMIYVGEEGNQEQAQALAEKLEEAHEDIEVEIFQGGPTCVSIPL